MVTNQVWIPDRGDIVWLEFSPQSGHEQAGRRPSLVISPADYNGRTGLMLGCPITSQVKRYPFELPLPGGLAVHGVVLCDQLRNLDWQARNAAFICTVPQIVVREVVARIAPLLDLKK